jgi:hypothetical protein
VDIDKMMGLSWDSLKLKRKWFLPVYLSVRPPKSNHSEFLRMLAKTKRVEYNWKHGVLYVKDAENWQTTERLGIRHADFAKAVNRVLVATSAEMILLLSLSNIAVSVEEWEEYFVEGELDKLLRFINRIVKETP